MRSDRRAPVAIIGGGYSGTILAAQLARRGIANILIDGSGRMGRGVAYSTTEPAHLLEVESPQGKRHLVPFTERVIRKVDPAAKRVVIDKDNTTIVDGAGSAADIKARIQQLKAQIDDTTSDWDREKQISVLRDKLQELTLLQLRLSTNLVPITEEYRAALGAYLYNSEKGGLPLFKKTTRRHATETALQELTAIDVRREELRKPPTPGAP